MFDCQILLLSLDKRPTVAPKKFDHFNSKFITSRTVESTLRGLIVNIALRF